MPKVAKVNSSDELGLSAGKNSLLSTLANRPNTVKSNHSSALPIVEEITTRRRICAMASVCICPSFSLSAPRCIAESIALLGRFYCKAMADHNGQFRSRRPEAAVQHLPRAQAQDA